MNQLKLQEKFAFLIFFFFLLLCFIYKYSTNDKAKSNIACNLNSNPPETKIIENCEDNIIDEIVKLSDEQLLVNKHYLMKAYMFSTKNTDEYDSELIEFVKTYINQPSKLPINLIDKSKTDFSQIGQSKVMDTALKSMRNGFFIEAGGFNGEKHSVIFIYLILI